MKTFRVEFAIEVRGETRIAEVVRDLSEINIRVGNQDFSLGAAISSVYQVSNRDDDDLLPL